MLEPHAFTIMAWCCCRYWHDVAVVVEMLLGFWKDFWHGGTMVMTHFLWGHMTSQWLVTDLVLLWLLTWCCCGCYHCVGVAAICDEAMCVWLCRHQPGRQRDLPQRHLAIQGWYPGTEVVLSTRAFMHTPTPTSHVHIHTHQTHPYHT